MNGLPSDTNLSALYGRTIEQIRFSNHNLQILFEGEDGISVQSAIDMHINGKDIRIIDYRAFATEICSILTESISHAALAPKMGVEIRLTNGTRISIDVDDPHYEAFQIRLGELLLVG